MRRCCTVPAFQSGLMWWNMSSASPLSFLAPKPLSVITQKLPSAVALMPEKPCIGWPLNGVETPVRRGADAGEMYDVPGMVPIASTRRHSGPVYLPAIANDSGASFGGSNVIARAGSTAWPASVAGNCCWAEASSGAASATANNAQSRYMAFLP